jgi:hypothetical protein
LDLRVDRGTCDDARRSKPDRLGHVNRFDIRSEWLFIALIASYCAIYALFYPATISILDESSIVALAYSIAHGSIYTENAGPFWDAPVHNHMIGKFSPFHAALIAPAIAIDWRLAFLVSAAFFVTGAFVLRAMLRRDGLGSGWTALYFLLAGALYYSQTIMAAVPASVMCLLGISLCLRRPARPFLGGLALGVSVLFHPWMGPIAIVFSAVWMLESRFEGALGLVVGALPAVIALAVYNYLITGSPLRNFYTMSGHQYLFDGRHLIHFFLFYAVSLAIFPLAGWSVFSRRWSGTWALPAIAVLVLVMGSFYYYRDGLNVGSTRVGLLASEIAGLVPGQRFLLPLSMVACLPAARFLNSRISQWQVSRDRLKLAALVVFIAGFTTISGLHQSYLRCFATIQSALYQNIPSDSAVAVTGDLTKELAPLRFVYRGAVVVDPDETPAPSNYAAILVSPGESPPPAWARNREFRTVVIRSWIWNRDLLIAPPASRAR